MSPVTCVTSVKSGDKGDYAPPMSPRKLLSLTMSLALSLGFIGLVAGQAQAVVIVPCTTSSNAFAGGNGTTATPYLVSNQTQFAAMNDPNLMDCEFKLTQDITFTLGGATSTPTVSTGSMQQFTGVFDGDGHTISGVNVNDGSYPGGLFRYIGVAVIKNVTVVGSVTVPSQTLVGGVIGMTDQGSTITNVHARVAVTGTSRVGGITGWLAESTISQSSSTGAITATADSAGGLVGYTRGQVNNVPAQVIDSFATGSVTSGAGYQGIAALVGRSEGGLINIVRSFAKGQVTGGDGSRQDCYDFGSFHYCNTQYGTTGGLIAPNFQGTSYGADYVATNSVWDTETTGRATSADNKGTGKTTAQMKSFSTFDQMNWSIAQGYNVNKTWGICAAANGGYPYLISGVSSDPCTPSISAISPAHGDVAGGTSVEITGANLSDIASVTFGGTNASNFTINSPTKITATTPAGTAGTVNVVVTDSANVTSTLTSAFTYDAPAATPTPTPSSQGSSGSPEPTPTASATSTPESSTMTTTPLTPTEELSSRSEMRQEVRDELPTKKLSEGLNVLLKKPVTASDGTPMKPSVHFIYPQSLRPTGDVARSSRAVISRSGTVRIFIGSPKPSNVLLTLRSAKPINGKTLVVRKAYAVR